MEILASPPTIPGKVFESREIPSDVALVVPLVCRLVERLCVDGCVAAADRRKVELCLNEAVTNAVIHGNGSDFRKTVRVQLFRDGNRWGTLITDQGEGFSDDEVPDLDAEEQLWQECGRGIALMRIFMDEVTYFDGGRSVRLIRQCPPSGEKRTD
jgi:serine/threonine-protein kinase RsbW